MYEPAFLRETVVLFGIAIAAAWAFRRIKAPTILGFLFAGIVIGPSSLGLIPHENVARFAELGLVLLLFTIGLELSPIALLRAGPRLAGAGLAQIASTAAAACIAVRLFCGMPWSIALLMGTSIALSSTAIALKQMSDRGEAGTSLGIVTTGILIFQDIFVIVLMVVMPLIAPGDGTAHGASLMSMALAIGLLAVALLAGRRVLPPVLAEILRYGGQELLALFAVFMACGGAWLAAHAGWPLSIGACVAGLLLASADLRHQLVAEIVPFRDVFNALFFISLGMLVDVGAVLPQLHWIVLAVAATLLVKPLLTALCLGGARWPARIGVHVGVGLCTVSEFGYALAHEATRLGIMDEAQLEMFTTYIVGTMMAGAAFFPFAGVIARGAGRLLERGSPGAHEPDGQDESFPKGHVILAGFGENGVNLARVLRATHIPFRVIEMNPALVRRAENENIEAVVGDATRMSILKHAGLQTARALVVAVNDPEATRRIVAQARAARPELYIVARTRAARELERLERLGASLVVSTNFEASIEIFARVLREFGVPGNIVEAQIASARAKGYGLLRGAQGGRIAYMDALLKVLQTTVIQSFFLGGHSPAADKTIAEFNLRARAGVTIIAVVRDGKPTTNPPADFRMMSGDVLVLVGAHAQLDEARVLLEADAVVSELQDFDERGQA